MPNSTLDKWIPGYKPRETKEVSHDNLKTEYRRNYIPHPTTEEKYSNEYIKQVIENDPWIKLDKWPNFKCENGHIINVNFIEVDAERLLDDVYGKILEEDYKKLHDTLLR